MAKATASKTKSSAPPRNPGESDMRALKSKEPSHEEVAQRAYELYCARGPADGDALGDWLAAEAELRGGAYF